MSGPARWPKVAFVALLLLALVRPGTTAVSQGVGGASGSPVAAPAAGEALALRNRFRPEAAPRSPAPNARPYVLLTAEQKPLTMLLAGIALIVLIAYRRSRALNA